MRKKCHCGYVRSGTRIYTDPFYCPLPFVMRSGLSEHSSNLVACEAVTENEKNRKWNGTLQNMFILQCWMPGACVCMLALKADKSIMIGASDGPITCELRPWWLPYWQRSCSHGHLNHVTFNDKHLFKVYKTCVQVLQSRMYDYSRGNSVLLTLPVHSSESR